MRRLHKDLPDMDSNLNKGSKGLVFVDKWTTKSAVVVTSRDLGAI